MNSFKKNDYFIYALICTFSVSNLYYNQPLLPLFLKTFNISVAQVGIIPLITQASYALGLILFVPLADFFPQKKILLVLFTINSFASLIASLTHQFAFFMLASFIIGITSVGAQIIIPMVSLLAPAKERSVAVSLMLSGLMSGVLLGRIISGFIAEYFNWFMVYRLAALLNLLFMGLIFVKIPYIDHPISKLNYFKILGSLFSYFFKLKPLKSICFSGGLVFAATSALWGALALLMRQPPYYKGSSIVGFLGLTGIAGILITPYLGKLIQQYGKFRISLCGSILTIIGFLLLGCARFSLVYIIFSLILLDIAARANLVTHQIEALNLSDSAKNRINTIFMVIYFTEGAIGTWFGSQISHHYSWWGIAMLGVSLGITSLAFNIWRNNSLKTK